MNIEIILSVWVAMLIYNIVFRAIASIIISETFKKVGSKEKDKIKKTFKERMAEMENERNEK